MIGRVNEIVDRENYYNITFANMVHSDPVSMFYTTGNQVRNLPNELDVLVIPVAAGIQMAGILWGIKKLKKKIKRIIGVEVGPSRRTYIDKLFPERPNYEMKSFDGPFNKEIEEYLTTNEYLDGQYEAKAYNFMKNKLRIVNKKVCFWIVGSRLIGE